MTTKQIPVRPIPHILSLKPEVDIFLDTRNQCDGAWLSLTHVEKIETTLQLFSLQKEKNEQQKQLAVLEANKKHQEERLSYLNAALKNHKK